MTNDSLPDGVRAVPGPAVRWQIQTQTGLLFDGYVFEDDPTDLARFIRWLAEDHTTNQHRLTLQKIMR